jgi:hypothetical protein
VRIFAVDPADHRDEYERQGWVHIKNGMTPEFLAALNEFVERAMNGGRGDERFAFQGKKEQIVYDFAADFADYPGELYDFVSVLCGLDRDSITLSERHFQVYDPNADPEPAAHKDRYGSQVSMGFSVAIPEVSRLVLYPHDHRSLNPFNSSVAFRASLQPHEQPDVALRTAREVELADEAGDIVAFPGSSTWHLRRRSAGAVNLYCKFNDFNCDPLGEDPSTPTVRERSLDLLASANGDRGGLKPVHGRRFDKAARVYARQPGIQVYEANVWGEEPFGLTDGQFAVLQAVDGSTTWAELREQLGGQQDVDECVKYLVTRGALDLAPAS